MHDRMVVECVDIALRTVGMTPICVLEIPPPLAKVLQIDRMAWRREDQRAGIKHVRQCTGIVLRIGWNFRKGFVAGGADELLELPVGHWRAVDPETVDGDAMDRRLFRVVFVGPHAERTAGNAHHFALIVESDPSRTGHALCPLLRQCVHQ
jgi:hypothetical protein